MTHPAATIAGVVSLVAIVTVVGALRLSPDAGTDKLVDNGSSAFEGTKEFRDRFGDDAIVILAEGDLKKLMLTSDIDRLLALETCLAGKPDASGQFAAPVCQDIADLGATRVVFGPATFINEAAAQSSKAIATQLQSLQGASPQEQQQAVQQFLDTGLSPTAVLQGLSIDNTQFVSSIVFDQTRPGAPPKSKFGYLFPSDRGALISIRLDDGISEDTRREAIGLIRTAVGEDAFSLRDASYDISGVPVIVQGLADALGGQIVILFTAAMIVMAIVLLLVFGPPLRLLPLLIALGAAGFAFGLLSLLGGTLTMASVAVLPVVIGLGRRLRDPAPGEIQGGGRGRPPTSRGRRDGGVARRPGHRHRGGRDLGRLPLPDALADPDGPGVRDRARRRHRRRPADLALRGAGGALDDRRGRDQAPRARRADRRAGPAIPRHGRRRAARSPGRQHGSARDRRRRRRA